MEIEVVEFYLIDHDKATDTIRGTLHIYVPEIDLDIRGCQVTKKKHRWFIGLPNRRAIDEDTGETVRFPLVSFADATKTTALVAELRTKGRAYIEQKLTETGAKTLKKKPVSRFGRN